MASEREREMEAEDRISLKWTTLNSFISFAKQDVFPLISLFLLYYLSVNQLLDICICVTQSTWCLHAVQYVSKHNLSI